VGAGLRADATWHLAMLRWDECGAFYRHIDGSAWTMGLTPL
jgi:hypothetical protein